MDVETPKNGLLKRAIKENNLLKNPTVMIGDKKNDFLAKKKKQVCFFNIEKKFFKIIKIKLKIIFK